MSSLAHFSQISTDSIHEPSLTYKDDNVLSITALKQKYPCQNKKNELQTDQSNSHFAIMRSLPISSQQANVQKQHRLLLINDTAKNLLKNQPKFNSIEQKRYFMMHKRTQHSILMNDSLQNEFEEDTMQRNKHSGKRVRFSKSKLICKDNYKTQIDKKYLFVKRREQIVKSNSVSWQTTITSETEIFHSDHKEVLLRVFEDQSKMKCKQQQSQELSNASTQSSQYNYIQKVLIGSPSESESGLLYADNDKSSTQLIDGSPESNFLESLNNQSQQTGSVCPFDLNYSSQSQTYENRSREDSDQL